jgi:hypothetical protein
MNQCNAKNVSKGCTDPQLQPTKRAIASIVLVVDIQTKKVFIYQMIAKSVRLDYLRIYWLKLKQVHAPDAPLEERVEKFLLL